jgi:hypothetical protein
MTSILAIIFLYLIPLQSHADECIQWFLKTGIKPGTPSCEVTCSSAMVDMGTFTCPNRCTELCKSELPNQVANIPYVKGITEGDKVVIAKYPKEALKVYAAKKRADDLTLKVFGSEGKNDESDAFRHFVWSGLLVKEIGAEKAKIFLTAHEQDPGQPAAEKKMDTANNTQGVNFAVSEIKSGKNIDLDTLERAALEKLKQKQLDVLSPSNKKIPEGYYSK